MHETNLVPVRKAAAPWAQGNNIYLHTCTRAYIAFELPDALPGSEGCLENASIFSYSYSLQRENRAGEFPGRTQHFFGCLAVNLPCLQGSVSSLAAFLLEYLQRLSPQPSLLTKICVHIGKINEFGPESLSRY